MSHNYHDCQPVKATNQNSLQEEKIFKVKV